MLTHFPLSKQECEINSYTPRSILVHEHSTILSRSETTGTFVYFSDRSTQKLYYGGINIKELNMKKCKISTDSINAYDSKEIEINDEYLKSMSVPYWIKYPNAQSSKQLAKPSILCDLHNGIGCSSDIKINTAIEHQVDFQNAGFSKSHALPSETH